MLDIKERFNSPHKKASAILIAIFGILWFAYFIVACTYISDPINNSALRVWVTTPSYVNQDNSRVFPQLTLCPHGSLSGKIVSLQCDNYDWETGQLVKTLTPVYINNLFPDYPDWTCYSYNSEGADSNIDFLNCSGIVDGGSYALHAFFDDPGSGSDFFDDYNRPPSNDNWVNVMGTNNDIGIDMSIWNTADPTGGPIGSASISSPTRQYQVHAQVTSPTPKGNMTYINIWWDSQYVWHYQQQNPFTFFQWLGFIGGAGFILRIIHEIAMAIFTIIFGSKDPRYAEIQ